jgi:hypothetical protein
MQNNTVMCSELIIQTKDSKFSFSNYYLVPLLVKCKTQTCMSCSSCKGMHDDKKSSSVADLAPMLFLSPGSEFFSDSGSDAEFNKKIWVINTKFLVNSATFQKITLYNCLKFREFYGYKKK